MSTPQNGSGSGTRQRVIAGIAIGITMLGVGLFLSNDKAVTELRIRVDNLERVQNEIKTILETNRTENNGAHDKIEGQLRTLLYEVTKR